MSGELFGELAGGFAKRLGEESASALFEWIKLSENREKVKKVAVITATCAAVLAGGFLVVSALAVAPVEVVGIVVYVI
ncbi:hypothetical protein [Streptomyces sp. NPDC005303]|uniref:hypothetical protein n=1 Tax=Streptomyces sp. NPDC005303 TaxID=3155713 RepID=UPI0033A388BF